MKTVICKCKQCRLEKKYGPTKPKRRQTYEVRAARSKVRQMLRTLPPEEINDTLPCRVVVDYYS